MNALESVSYETGRVVSITLTTNSPDSRRIPAGQRNFTAFHTGMRARRPAVETEHPCLVLAGDWVALQCPATLMEAAVTAGRGGERDPPPSRRPRRTRLFGPTPRRARPSQARRGCELKDFQASGIYYRAGSVAIDRVTEEVLHEIDRGTLYATSKRLILDASRKSTTIPYSRIINVTRYDDGHRSRERQWQGSGLPVRGGCRNLRGDAHCGDATSARGISCPAGIFRLGWFFVAIDDNPRSLRSRME